MKTYTDYEMVVWEKAFMALLGSLGLTGNDDGGDRVLVSTAVRLADDAVEAYRTKRKEARPE